MPRRLGEVVLQTVAKDFGASAWSTSKVKRSARVTDEEDGSESEDSINNINAVAVTLL